MEMPRLAFRLICPGIVAASLLAAGCAEQVAGGPSIPPDNPPPSIDQMQLAYDPATRTVHFYELVTDAKTGRKGTWEVLLPRQTVAYPQGKTFRLPGGVDEAEVVIRASDPPGPPSPGVRLADVPWKPTR
jgi:hypothetical protein